MAIKITTYQDSLEHWHAQLVDSDGNVMTILPQHGDYGADTELEARQMMQTFVVRKERQGIDIEGGGYKGGYKA